MKKRIITGVIGILLLIVVMVFRNTIVLNIALALFSIIAMFEIHVSTRIVNNNYLLILSCLYAIVSSFFVKMSFIPIGLFITTFYIFASVLILLDNYKKVSLFEFTWSVGMTLVICLGLNSIQILNALPNSNNNSFEMIDGLFFMILAFGGAWFGDTGAYFIGSKFGKHKLAPQISPNKTYEGLIGGILFNIIIFVIFGLIWNGAILQESASLKVGWLIVFAVTSALIGLIGDLFFSAIKRERNLKDYGKIMPGHGGVLDRVDSLIFVAPYTYLFLQFLPIIVR